MKRRTKRRKSYRMNAGRRRSSYRRNVYVNPHKRRSRRRSVASYRSNPPARRAKRRKAYRRNPDPFSSLFGGGTILGFPIKQVAIAGGAVIAAPFLERQILSLIPVEYAAKPSGRWAAKIGGAVATGILSKYTLGGEASRLAYIVLGANLIADAYAEFLSPAPAGAGLYVNTGMGYYPQLGGPAGGAYIGASASARGGYVGLPYGGVPPVATVGYKGQDPFQPVF